MKRFNSKLYTTFFLIGYWLLLIETGYAMGIRSFVALPVEKEGAVIRFTLEHAQDADKDSLIISAVYGLTAHQTLLLGFPYRLSPAGENRPGDVSVLYRHIYWKDDQATGTSRLGFLGGALVPTESTRDGAIQAGFVFTHFKNRHEIDFDTLYQAGMDSRPDSGRYDISWQYRLSPTERPDWGLVNEINSVLELNGRWISGSKVTHQITAGLQSIHQEIVIEAGVVKEMNNKKETLYLISTRFHF